MRHSIEAKNARIELLDHPADSYVLLNIYYHTKPKGEYDQVVLPRHSAKALGILLRGEADER